MSSKKKGWEIREKDVRRALDVTPANGTPVERERELLKHELENLQQMNLSLQAVLQMVVSFKKTVEEVIQNSDHFAGCVICPKAAGTLRFLGEEKCVY